MLPLSNSLGRRRTTEDSDGEIAGVSEARPERAEIEAMLPRFTGAIMQTSAGIFRDKNRRSPRLCAGPRRQPPALTPRPVEIVSLRLIAIPDRDHADCEAVVSKGTYIRALARDLALALGTLGHVAALRRLSVGPVHRSASDFTGIRG